MLLIPDEIQFIIDILSKNGYDAYIVGGCVRDMLLGRKPLDYDITTSATPDIVMLLFEKTIPTGIKHGTVTVIINGITVEVTTFRLDGKYNDFRRPEDVKFVSELKQDLSRRDFTVNSLAFNNETGIIDYFGGVKDIEAEVLKTVGDPNKRFIEDALRILRLFRFASVLKFSIEDTTLNAAINKSQGLEFISKERIISEFEKLVCGENAKVIEPLIKAGGLEFLKIKKVPDFNSILKLSDNKELALFSFFFTSDVNIEELCENMNFSNKRKKYFLSIYKLINTKLPQSITEIKNLMNIYDISYIFDYLRLYSELYNFDTLYDKKMIKEVLNNNEPYKIEHLKLNGNDLIKIGIKGEKVGNILECLRRYVVSHPENNNKSVLIEKALELIRN